MDPTLIPEAEAKAALARFGLRVPASRRAQSATAAAEAAAAIGFPVVLKGEGIAHKTEAGAVRLDLGSAQEVLAAADQMPTDRFLVEEMIGGTVAELLVGVVHDPAHGFILTLGAGGTLAELLADRASLLLPATDADILAALDNLRIAPMLRGYRGRPAADLHAVLDAVRAVQDYCTDHAQGLEEIEINPLICTPTQAIAADALLRRDIEQEVS